MLLDLQTFVILVIIGSYTCTSEESNILPNEVTNSETDFCADIKHSFAIEKNLKLNEFQDLPPLEQDNKTLEEYELASKHLLVGNRTELLLSEVFGRIFQKLEDLRNNKLNQVVLSLKKENPHSFEYFLLNSMAMMYNKNITKKVDVKTSQKINVTVNISESFLPKQKTYDYKYFDYLSDKDLKTSATYLICGFLTLGNLTNDYNSVNELLQPLKVIIEDDQSSLSMLIFTNKFLAKVMEGNGDRLNIYKDLFTKYVINQLQTVVDFNISELFKLENISNTTIREDFETLEQLNPDRVSTLALKWRFKIESMLNKSNTLEYFRVMDEAFREVSEKRTAESAISYRSLKANDGPMRSTLLHKIRENVNTMKRNSPRIGKILGHIKKIASGTKTSTPLLRFAYEILQQFNTANPHVMPHIYKYISDQLNTIEPFNASVLNAIRDKKMDELAQIVYEYVTIYPGSIITMALDWLFDFKIDMLTQGKTKSVFEILQNSFEEANTRRRARLMRSNRIGKPVSKIIIRPVELAKTDEEILEKAIN